MKRWIAAASQAASGSSPTSAAGAGPRRPRSSRPTSCARSSPQSRAERIGRGAEPGPEATRAGGRARRASSDRRPRRARSRAACDRRARLTRAEECSTIVRGIELTARRLPWRRSIAVSTRRSRPVVILLAVASASWAPRRRARASRSATSTSRDLTLAVNAKGEALLTYTRQNGKVAARPALGRDQRSHARPERPAGRVQGRLRGRLGEVRAAPATGRRSRTRAGRTTGRRSSSASRRARRRTAATGRCRRGSGFCRCAASPRSGRSRAHSASTSRTGAARSP